ncbi:hypothetical protein ASZ90_018500 [hydrocarbon metagenome]|uniref:Uncharacterized protein n=1 Tax=hydrocarbon metagenome TaxID=938273 RepID=A0A0W8E6P6_9ZZZZ
MEISSIEKYIPLKREYLDPYHYTLSLLKEAERLDLMSQKTIGEIHKQLMILLGESIIEYTGGESTSVKIENGESIMLSILYCMDACTRSFPHPRDAINLLITSSIKDIYKGGLEIVELCLRETEILFQETKKNKLDIPIEAYQSTIDKDLPDFFRNYDVLFGAHNTMATFDYPLLFDDMKIQGIYYIRQYLAKLAIETSFCHLFALQDIRKLLCDYGRVYRIDYKEALINIFEIVLTNSIFSVLSGNKAREIMISKIQFDYLQEKLQGLDQTQCLAHVNEAVEHIISELAIVKPELREYIRKLKGVLMPRFLCARENGSLTNVIILDLDDNHQADIFFDEGNRLDDDTFRSLVDEIMDQAKTAEKVDLISSRIQSLADFIDVLEAECLYGDEFTALYDTLGDLELSILGRIVYMEELRADPSSFSLLLTAEEQSANMQWQIEYRRFMRGLSLERLKSIEKLIQSPVQVTES